jgi:hypothetical protein
MQSGPPGSNCLCRCECSSPHQGMRRRSAQSLRGQDACQCTKNTRQMRRGHAATLIQHCMSVGVRSDAITPVAKPAQKINEMRAHPVPTKRGRRPLK